MRHQVLRRSHYERVAANRAYFGDFDPFGDFDLLFGAARLNLKIADVPIRYKERTYGTTNIQRWKHGWLLLRMVLFRRPQTEVRLSWIQPSWWGPTLVGPRVQRSPAINARRGAAPARYMYGPPRNMLCR